jgi:Na+-transporting methylmalonyl-CoA/oxaloacetate decarboxylase gamma subunit
MRSRPEHQVMGMAFAFAFITVLLYSLISMILDVGEWLSRFAG